MTEAIPNTRPNKLWKAGRLCNGTMGIMINMQPEKIPAEAAPAIALPTMKMMELGAAPQMAEPISKTTTLAKKTLKEHNVLVKVGFSVC